MIPHSWPFLQWGRWRCALERLGKIPKGRVGEFVEFLGFGLA